MQIPDSIEKLTTSIASTSLTPPTQFQTVDINEIIFAIKKGLTLKEQEKFEQGLAFFNSDSLTDKQVLRNFLKLILEVYTTAINSSEINQEYIENVKSSLKHTFEGLTQNMDSLLTLLVNLNKQNNFLDSKQISLIILGYAIGTIKRLYRS